MASHTFSRNAMHHLDTLNWPVITISAATWPWLSVLWEHAPTWTGIYMGVSGAFMLFQMSDKLGWLERFKRRPKREIEDY